MKRASFLRSLLLAGLLAHLFTLRSLRADTAYNAWLRYAPLTETERARYASFPAVVTVLNDSALLQSAQAELTRGVRGMLGRTLRAEKGIPQNSSLVLGTLAELRSIAPELPPPKNLSADGYGLANVRIKGHDCIIVAGSSERGTLYGVFALLRKIAFAEDLSHLQETQQPANPVRWVNDWDNLDGEPRRTGLIVTRECRPVRQKCWLRIFCRNWRALRMRFARGACGLEFPWI